MAHVTSRRTLTRGAAWSVPALALTQSAPAMAASCDPSTNVVSTSSALTFSNTGSLVDNPSNVTVTYVNTGPDPLLAGTVLTIQLVGSYAQDGTVPTAAPSGLPSSTTFSVSGKEEPGRDVPAYRLTVQAVLGQALDPSQSISIAMNASGFSQVSSSTAPDTQYGGAETSYISEVTDSTASGQSFVDACRTVNEVITVSS